MDTNAHSPLGVTRRSNIATRLRIHGARRHRQLSSGVHTEGESWSIGRRTVEVTVVRGIPRFRFSLQREAGPARALLSFVARSRAAPASGSAEHGDECYRVPHGSSGGVAELPLLGTCADSRSVALEQDGAGIHPAASRRSAPGCTPRVPSEACPGARRAAGHERSHRSVSRRRMNVATRRQRDGTPGEHR
jgi:hypothetical protein